MKSKCCFCAARLEASRRRRAEIEQILCHQSSQYPIRWVPMAPLSVKNCVRGILLDGAVLTSDHGSDGSWLC